MEIVELSSTSLNQVFVKNYRFVTIALPKRFYRLNSPAPLISDFPGAETGIPTYERKGVQYFHPVVVAQQALRQLASFEITNNPIYLERAEKMAAALLTHSTLSRGAMWFPYEFDFALHGEVNETAEAPWYSGMAQGQALSLFSRLYEVTRKVPYAVNAVAVFNSLALVGISEDPWVSRLVDGFYWIEEYPTPVPDKTLNGYLFSIIGLYDFYQALEDPRSLLYMRAALTTISQALPNFRSEKEISHYCLTHLVQSERYHELHIEQLNYMSDIVDTNEFSDWAKLFASDH